MGVQMSTSDDFWQRCYIVSVVELPVNAIVQQHLKSSMFYPAAALPARQARIVSYCQWQLKGAVKQYPVGMLLNTSLPALMVPKYTRTQSQ